MLCLVFCVCLVGAVAHDVLVLSADFSLFADAVDHVPRIGSNAGSAAHKSANSDNARAKRLCILV